MVTQVIFKIDKKLKDKAMAKAQNEGIAFSSVLKFATKAFVDGDFELGLVGSGSEKFNATTSREIKRALADIAKGKNMSPSFSSVAELRKSLES